MVRQLQKQNASREASSSDHNYSAAEPVSQEPSPASSKESNDSSPTPPKGPLQWIIYSANQDSGAEEKDKPLQVDTANPASRTGVGLTNARSPIPESLRQNMEDASIAFFFRHYTGTQYTPHLENPFTRLWQPLYKAASINSPLRLATVALTVNITMMWNFRGCDARPARALFTKAVAATREAINNPLKENLDELLMTVLLFDLYDALVLHYVHNAPSTYGKHKIGALALVKHRGLSILNSGIGRALALATRHGFLDYSLSQRIPMPAGSDDIFSHLSMPDNKTVELDYLATQIIDAQARFWAGRRRRRSQSAMPREQRRIALEGVVADAIRLDELLMAWKRNLASSDWIPVYLSRDEVAPSILAAGFYGDRCAVWIDLPFAEVTNIYAYRRLVTLQMIRQAIADEPSLLTDPKYRAYLAKANTTMQSLVDAILETIPLHIGDTVVPTNPIYSSEISYPYKTRVDPETGKTRTIPDFEHQDFRGRAAASGGWMIFAHLTEVYRFAEPEDDAEPLILRDGQLDWIKGQMKRLQTIFLFCDPVW